MSCTTEDPCHQPILRWVHSDRCKIDTPAAANKALRAEVKRLEAERDAIRALMVKP